MDGRPAATVVQIWRYPVKSMQGEALAEAALGERGIAGDRAYAILDRATGTIASAKHPRKWAALLACSARFAAPPRAGAPPPPVRITLPDGSSTGSDDPAVDRLLSAALGREVALITALGDAPEREADRTPLDGPGDEPLIRREPLALGAAAGTFFDYGTLHMLSTASLAHLQTHHPAGLVAARRFRPNLLLAAPGAEPAELAWLGRELRVGAAAVRAIDPCPRCVVTTLAQGDLPRDPGILRALTAHTAAASVTLAPGHVFQAVAGIYASVLVGGPVRLGDEVVVEPA